MVGLEFTVKDLAGDVGVREAQYKQAIRIGLSTAMDHWILRFLPMHFSSDAGARYGYQPRTSAYNRRKESGSLVYSRMLRQRVARPRPVSDGVYSGDLKRHVVSQPLASYKKVARSIEGIDTVEIKLQFPPLFYPQRIKDELKKVSPDEWSELRAILKSVATAEAERLKATNALNSIPSFVRKDMVFQWL